MLPIYKKGNITFGIDILNCYYKNIATYVKNPESVLRRSQSDKWDNYVMVIQEFVNQ